MAIVQGSPVPTFVIDRDHRIVFWNHALEEYSGIRADDIVGRAEAWRAFYPAERPTLSDLIVDRAVDQIPLWYGTQHAPSALVEGAYEATDFFPHMKGGTWLFFTAAPVYDSAGAIIGSVEILQDITEQKLAELAQTSYAERLERSNEDLGRFAYVASHDLQEPLRSIIGFSQLLERRYKGQLGEDADEFIGFIIEGGNRMQRLIEDLLQLSRVETTAKPPVATDAGRAAADAVALFTGQIGEVGGSVDVGPLPTVMADPAQLDRVFANLIGNAIKYRRPDVPPVVRISARRTGSMVEFAVQDNGIGIAARVLRPDLRNVPAPPHERRLPRHRDRARDRQADRRPAWRQVRVESTPGEGSTFFFTLPAA